MRMTRSQISKKYNDRILAVLANVATRLEQLKVVVVWPYWEPHIDSWRMLVYVWTEKDKPKDYLDLVFDLDWNSERETAMFVLNLHEAEVEYEPGVDVGESFQFLGQVTPGIRSPLNDREGIEWQMRYFESLDVQNEIVERIRKAVETSRKRRGPREWSPRWDKPSMGATRGMKTIRVNIVEEDGWKNWDYAQEGGISDWSADNAWDDFTNMDDRTCQGYIQDLVNASMTKTERKKIGPEDLERICEELKENTWENLESIYHAIVDAHQWAWEVAYTPDDLDIKKAMDRANYDWDIHLGDYWDLVIQDEVPEGPREWTPRSHWTTPRLFKDLSERIRYERKPGYYDRFIIFDWGKSEPVLMLLEELKKHPDRGDVDFVQNELEEWSQDYLREFFKALEGVRENSDPHYNWDLDPHWKNMLKDKQTMKGVRNEILEFLAKPKKEEVED